MGDRETVRAAICVTALFSKSSGVLPPFVD